MSKIHKNISNIDILGKRSNLKYMSLKEFICTYKDDINEYFDLDIKDTETIEVSQIYILCIVDTGEKRYTIKNLKS